MVTNIANAPLLHTTIASNHLDPPSDRFGREQSYWQRSNTEAAVPPAGPSPASPFDEIFTDHREPRVFVPVGIAAHFEGGNEAILASQLLYWFGSPSVEYGRQERTPTRARLADDEGQTWFATSNADLEEQTGLSHDQIKRGLHALRQQQCIDTRRNPHVDRRRILVRLTDSFPQEVETSGQRGVTVYAGVTRMVGTAPRALVLSQILYWFTPGQNGRSRLRVRRNGQLCLAKRHSDLADETGLTDRQVKRAIDFLKARELITCSVHKFQGQRSLHIWLQRDAFARAWRDQDDVWCQRRAEDSDL